MRHQAGRSIGASLWYGVVNSLTDPQWNLSKLLNLSEPQFPDL